MAELLISSVTEDGIKASGLSETFSSLHQIVISPKVSGSTEPAFITIDGYNVSLSTSNGLECINILPNLTVGVRDVFDFSIQTDVNRFETWVNSVSTGIILMKSEGTNVSTDVINEVFRKYGSFNWKYYWKYDNNTTNIGYSAIFDCGLKKIMTENFSYSDATTMVTFDTFSDIGTIGYGSGLISDSSSYFSNGTHIFKTILDNKPISDFSVNPGENILIGAEFFRDKISQTADESVRLYYIFFNGVTSISSGYITDTSSGYGDWINVEKNVVVPANTTNIHIYTVQWPNKGSYVGTVGIRNIYSYLKKVDVEKGGSSSFGRWGFITENVSESITDSASFINQDVLSTEYGNTDNYYFLEFFANDAKKITIPKLYPSSSCNYALTLSYSNTNDAIRLVNGSVDTIMFGCNTNNNPLGVGHVMAYNGVEVFIPSFISCNREYTYKIEVSGLTVNFYVDGVYKTSRTMVSAKTPFEITIGNSMSGYVVGFEYVDNTTPLNSRKYNMSNSKNLDFILGRSPISGMWYFEKNITPNPSSGFIYCGVGSLAAPGGIKSGGSAYITIVENNGATLNTGISLNTRYKATVLVYSNPTSSQQDAYMIVDGKSVITAGNINQLKINVEYLCEPNINAVNEGYTWVKNESYSFNFDGSSYVDIPKLTASSGETGYYDISFVCKAAGQRYLLEGRTSSNITQGGVYLHSNGTIAVYGGWKITYVNGSPVIGTPTYTIGETYNIVGEFIGDVCRIGSRYSNAEFFIGDIFDITLATSKETRRYSNVIDSKIGSYSNSLINGESNPKIVYNEVTISNWVESNPQLSTIRKDSNNKFTFIKDDSIGGISHNLNLPSKGSFRIEYDIESSKPIELKCSGVINNNAVSMKELNSGRYTGTISFINTSETISSGLYIKMNNPRINDTVTIRSLKVYKDVDDGIGNTISSGYKFNKFKHPVVVGVVNKSWVPDTSSGSLSLTPTWIPQRTGFRIHITGKYGVGNLTYGTDVNNGIFISTISNRVTCVIKNAGSTLFTSNLTVNIPQNKDFDLDLIYNGNTIVMKMNEFTVSSIYNITNDVGIGQLGNNFNGAIKSIELIDFIDYGNSRIFDLKLSSYNKPIKNKIENKQLVDKKFRAAKINETTYGWDSNIIVGHVNGSMKDTTFVNGYELNKVISGDINTSLIVNFKNNVVPFDSLEMMFYVDGNLPPLTLTAVKGVSDYRIAKNISLDDWIVNSSVYRKIMIYLPNTGLSFTVPWKEL